MNIGVDIDGVLANIDWPRIIYEKFGVFVPRGSIYSSSFQQILGITVEEEEILIGEAISSDPGLMIYASEVLEYFAQQGHKIYIVTARGSYNRNKEITLEWLERHEVHYEQIIWRPEEIGSLKLDVMLDDNIKKLLKLLPNITRQVVVFDQPWNSCYDLKKRFKRVYSWLGFKDLVNTCVKEEVLSR